MKKILMIASCGLTLAAGIYLAGCEVQSATPAQGDFTITPSATSLYVGDSATFSVQGGFEYTWSLSQPTWGVLSGTQGSTVTYTDRYDPGSNNAAAVQTITVVSTIPGNAGGGTDTNGTATTEPQVSVQATIEHKGTVLQPPVTSLYISPSAATVANNGSQEFTASGGDGVNYTWSVANSTWGRLSSLSGEKTTYTSTYDPGSGTNVLQIIRCQSGDGDVNVTIVQTH